MTQNEHFRVGHVCLVLIFLGGIWSNYCNANEDKQEYIVYMGSIPDHDQYSPSAHHVYILHQVLKKKSLVAGSLIRAYTRSFNGFAAKLTNEQKEAIEDMEGVVSVFPSKKIELYTTRSWDFMGLVKNVKRNLAVESNVIVGMIDSGIWPESQSFNDHGIGPIPKKWKGGCHGGFNFTCNKKLIGARFYTDDGTARDDAFGHGTHTSSTVAGMLVRNASFNSIAKGTARGAVPSARIAIYSCKHDCRDSGILAAFDDAIADGVDLISISMGYGDVLPGGFIDDAFSIGSFHALERNILTVQAAGNNGKKLGTMMSNTPWLLTVAASTMDRRIFTKVVVDNAMSLFSSSVNGYASRNLPILTAEDLVTQQCPIYQARVCSMKDCLNASVLESHIIMCDVSYGLNDNEGNESVNNNSVPAGIITSNLYTDVSSPNNFPYAKLSPLDYEVLKNYKATKRPEVVKATILKSKAIATDIAMEETVVASFSSRGPNVILPEILKPDITAPGVEVLAATPKGYEILSGTSMACPHVAGAAAYVKSFHPDWSASAIKSALMTNANLMNPYLPGNEEAQFAFGAGHLDPTYAVNPGLVYETSKKDYIALLFSIGYSKTKVSKITGEHNLKEPGCNTTRLLPKDLNYPTMMAVIKPNRPFNVTFERRVTNVGYANSVYNGTFYNILPANLKLTVSPSVLRFKSLKETKAFKVHISGVAQPAGVIQGTLLEWYDGYYSVKSQIVIYTSVSAMSMSSRILSIPVIINSIQEVKA